MGVWVRSILFRFVWAVFMGCLGTVQALFSCVQVLFRFSQYPHIQ